jgi:hypothetical protein
MQLKLPCPESDNRQTTFILLLPSYVRDKPHLTSLFIAYIFTCMRHSVLETSLHWTLDSFITMHCNKARLWVSHLIDKPAPGNIGPHAHVICRAALKSCSLLSRTRTLSSVNNLVKNLVREHSIIDLQTIVSTKLFICSML